MFRCKTPLSYKSLSRSKARGKPVFGVPLLGWVMQQVRQNTFLGTLTSIGGLLAVIQGLHVICFGRPLFWGLFGAWLALRQLPSEIEHHHHH